MPRGPESRTPGVSLPKAKMREALGRRCECTSRAHLRLQDLSRALQSCAQALQKELDPRPLSRPPRPSWGLRRCVSATAHPSRLLKSKGRVWRQKGRLRGSELRAVNLFLPHQEHEPRPSHCHPERQAHLPSQLLSCTCLEKKAPAS